MIKAIKFFLRHNESSLASFYRRIRSGNKLRENEERMFLLNYMKEGSEGAEIGVHRGEFSKFILENAQPKKLHLIDPWKWFHEEKYTTTLYGGKAGGGQRNMDLRYGRVKRRFSKQINSRQVVIHRMLSKQASKEITDKTLDWIYIDGDHSYEGVMNDLVNYYPKLKQGGFIIGDDYDEGNWYGDDIKRAVADFVATFRVDEVEIKNFQFILRKV